MQRPLRPQVSRTARFFGAAATLLCFACGSPDDPGLPDPGMLPPPGMDPVPPVPVPKDAVKLLVPPITVHSGKERTVCVTDKFPLTEAMNITQVATSQNSTHHVIFYKYQQSMKPPAVNKTPVDCQPLDLFDSGNLKVPLFIGESSDPAQNVLKLPPNVAYQVQANDYYTIEVHVVNATPKDIESNVAVYLSPAEAGSKPVPADMLFFNNASGLFKKYDGKQAGVPPLSMTTIDPAFFGVRSDFKVFGLTTHQHRNGAGISVSKSTSAANPGTPLFTNTDWQHPDLYHLPDDQPLTFKAGEGLRWVCSYNNTTTEYLQFGESGLTDEMCIIWGYYYPSIGFQLRWN